MFTVQSIQDPDWQKAVRELAVPLEAKIAVVMDAVGRETVAFLKAASTELRGWSKRTGELEGSYGYEVEQVTGGTMLTVRVDADHAIYLEARDGLFVLNGIADRGGPLERALIDVCRRLAPDWQVTLRMG